MNQPPSPKMTRAQARAFWSALSPQQKADFNKMYAKLQTGKLMLSKVNVDDNEQIQNIILEDKDKPSAPSAQFASHFKIKE